MKLLVALCVLVACSKQPDDTANGPAKETNDKAPVAAPPKQPVANATLEKLTGAPTEWQATYTGSLDYWTFSKRATGLSRDPGGYYAYGVIVRQAPALPTNGIELQAKATSGDLEKHAKFFSVDKNSDVPGGAAIIGMHGEKTEDASKADKEFFVVRDAGGGVKISCSPADTNPGSSDEMTAAAIALCSALTL